MQFNLVNDLEQVCSLLAWRGVALALLAYSLVCLWRFSVLALAVVALLFGHIPGFRRSRGQRYFHAV